MAKKTVRIVAHERVEYDQTFKMTAEEIARIKAAMSRGERALADEVDGWLNKMDVADGEIIDDVTVYVDGEEMYNE